MRARGSVFIATSLDGFIARKDGGLDWLDAANRTVSEDEDYGYDTFMESVDALVMGRKSYEKVLSFGAWPYGEKPVVVLSHRPIGFPDGVPGTVSCSSETPSQLCSRLFRQGARRLYVDGGVTIQGFLAAGLIDEITITVIPVLLGEGRPLFGGLEKDVSLRLVSARGYDSGFVQLKYEVLKGE